MIIELNGREYEITIDQPARKGSADQPVETDHAFIRGTPWYDAGYCVVDAEDQVFTRVRKRARQVMIDAMEKAGLQLPEHFNPEDYHRYITRDEQHYQVLAHVGKFLSPEVLDVDIDLLTELIRKHGYPEDVIDCKGVCHLRIVRPLKATTVMDNNPLHRDSWLEHLKHALNMYIPLFGSTTLNSLPLVPGSHRIADAHFEMTSDNAKIGDRQYSLPTIISGDVPLELTRPAIGHGQLLMFSSHLLHGCALNYEDDKTRMSLEIRFWSNHDPILGME